MGWEGVVGGQGSEGKGELPGGVVEEQLAKELLLLHVVGLGECGVGEVGVLREVEGEGETVLLALELSGAHISEVGEGVLVALEGGLGDHVVVLHGHQPELGNTLDV